MFSISLRYQNDEYWAFVDYFIQKSMHLTTNFCFLVLPLTTNFCFSVLSLLPLSTNFCFSVLPLTTNFCFSVSPRFITTPQDKTSAIGNSVRLSCQATGHPVPEIKWTKNGNPLSPTNRVNIMSSGDLHINNIHVEDQGLYRCTGINSGGTIGATARITVHRKYLGMTSI